MPYTTKDKTNKWFRDRYQKNIEFVRKYKLDKGCTDCGWKEHHAGLEFDHIEGKRRGSVSSQMGKSLKVILQEIEKCEVVCSRCHSIRTWNRGVNKGEWRVE